jgi:hypothetical protein
VPHTRALHTFDVLARFGDVMHAPEVGSMVVMHTSDPVLYT